jgi:hypothetical protein
MIILSYSNATAAYDIPSKFYVKHYCFTLVGINVYASSKIYYVNRRLFKGILFYKG